MRVNIEDMPELKHFVAPQFRDQRGCFSVLYESALYPDLPIFVQDNFSLSRKNVLRGLHYQLVNPQAKLIVPIQGRIFDVVVDIRKSSPQFGCWAGITLDAERSEQLFVPAGFAHGFLSLTDDVMLLYKVDAPYHPESDRNILWNDPTLNIAWPLERERLPILSDKDKSAPALLRADVFL